MKKLTSLLLVLLWAAVVRSQNILPVIKAANHAVTIRDGNITSLNAWNLDPTVKPDNYYTNVPQKNSRVTFITDHDSISFDTRYGQVYDFIVLLNGKDSCYTRISANYNGVITPTRLNANLKTDTIPFTLRGSRIYFNGKLNGHENMVIQLDLGAGGNVINKSSTAKTGVQFDGSTLLNNTHGVNKAPTSSNNTITIAGLKWDHVPLIQADNTESYEDAIIGNSLFGNRVIEIDYNKKILVVHQSLPDIGNGYSRHEVLFEQHRPKVKVTLTVGNKPYTDWFLFDTGRDGTMLIGEDFVGRFNLWDKFQTIFSLGNKKIVHVPQVTLGALTFKDIVTNAANPAKPAGRQSLLGNQLLNHFNVILDNQQGVIYLKPNSLQGNSYSDWAAFRLQAIGVIAGVILVITLLVLLFKKWRNRKKK